MAQFPSSSDGNGLWTLKEAKRYTQGDNFPKFSTRTFSISPAVSGKSTWDLDSDGPLTLSSYGDWTIVPTASFDATVKIWGGGGGKGASDGFSTANANGAGGGYAGGTFGATVATFVLRVGQGGGFTSKSAGATPSRTAFGGGGAATNYIDANWNCGGGGGLSGIFGGSVSHGSSILIAGGGGGGGNSRNGSNREGGAGGGTNGVDGAGNGGGGGGGTQSAGGTGASGAIGSSVSGSALQGGSLSSTSTMGGGGGGGYYGGGSGLYQSDDEVAAGGGGSGYINATYISSGTLTAGSGNNPGNSSDTDRGTSGNGATTAGSDGVDGKIILS